MNNQAIFLMGPTASGKTSLAMEIAQKLPIDIISVDSAMIYKGMDIGTGKPTLEELNRFPHKLIDICEPTEAYSTARFCHDAKLCMQESWDKQRIPLLVGGTMLYFKALQFGLAELPSANQEIREQIALEAKELGWPAMHNKLAQIDPITAARLSINDSQRIQRALEINLLTGKPLNESYLQQKKSPLEYKLTSLALIPSDRSMLHASIEKRFLHMLDLGLIEEVESLYKRGDLSLQMPSMRSVGYRQVWSYLNNEIDFNSMKDSAIAATRQLAKRQYTWLRSWPEVINLGSYTNDTLQNIMQLIDLEF